MVDLPQVKFARIGRRRLHAAALADRLIRATNLWVKVVFGDHAQTRETPLGGGARRCAVERQQKTGSQADVTDSRRQGAQGETVTKTARNALVPDGVAGRGTRAMGVRYEISDGFNPDRRIGPQT